MSVRDEAIKRSIEKVILNLLVSGDIKDPRIPRMLTITKVNLSRDKHYSHIFVAIDGSDYYKKQVITALNHAKGFIQSVIADKLQLRYTPKIEFRLDTVAEKASRIDEILAQISNESKE